MNKHKHKFIILYILSFTIITPRVTGESSTCLSVYKEGGAPAVFQSPKCPRWSLPENNRRRDSTETARGGTGRCQSAVRQGRRKASEDRTFCTLDIRIPFPGGPVNLYRDQMMCLHFGRSGDRDRDQCINPDGLSSFLGFLESLPAHSVEQNQESYERTTPNTRYILKKKFDRGSYGEVWVAFHWNYLQQDNNSNQSVGNRTFRFNTTHLGAEDGTSQKRTAQSDVGLGPPIDNIFILKRIMVERGNTVYLSGIREKYFGELFLNASTYLGGAQVIEDSWKTSHMSSRRTKQSRVDYEEGLKHIARYIESFESKLNEIWLVFRHEGISLSKLLYTADEIGSSDGTTNDDHIKHVRILHSSKWWRWLKTTKAGQDEMRNLIWQLLMALKSCHDRNITHRDIKPENMIVCFEDRDSGRCLKGSPSGNETYTTKMRIIDFGSAMDEFTIKHLYGSAGPSRDEQTYEYMPPEAFLNATWYHGPASITTKYDMWSVGVVILELIIGSPNVFQINAKTHALLEKHLEGWSEGLKELAYKLRSFMELCILLPGSSSKHLSWGSNGKSSGSPASWKCSEEFFSSQIKSRDPLKIGFPNVWALRLVRQLLVWDPEDRLTVDEALKHPYFTQHTT
ncbi:protein phosphatase 2C family protein [Artemisia annua]|uniref:Protein phosphatase 2C family protein n=1 Tax=Artemisia annua TaxID=35608 RepID=A0A2U1MW01_ARTAN|nr:protein phosphatase 2C family protein [Artemisia annua]